MASVEETPDGNASPTPGIGRGTISLILGILFVLLTGTAVGVTYLATRPPSDREIHAKLAGYLSEHRALRDRKAPDAEWDALEDRVIQDYPHLQSHLEDHASATEPAKQQLLWAMRDYLFPMLHDARTAPTREELMYERHLEQAVRLLR